MKNFTRPLGSIVLLAMLLINSFSYAGSTSAKEKASKDVSNSCPTITVTLSATNLTCHGSNNGTASVASVTGGVAPYTYSWNTGATTSTLSNLAVGSYTVTAKDANGCTGSKSISISQPGVLSVTINHNNVSCNGNNNGNATATVGGGTSPYVYAWSNGLTVSATPANLSPGTYTILVTDANSCQTTGSVTVTQPTALSLSTSSTNVNCNGNGTATVVASGGNGSYTYKWNNNATTATITGLAAGTYSVIVKDANLCVATATGVVVSNPGPLSAGATHTNVTCSSLGTATVTASGSTSPYTYLWSNGATTSSVSGLVAGTYSVTVYDVYNCSTSVTGITITQPSAVTANGSTTNVSCFGGSNGTASVTAGGGTSPYTYSWNTGATTSSISSLSAGTYSVTVTDHNGCTGTATGLVVSQPASALSASGSTTNVSCFGGNNGTASVTASGGTSGYTYLWSNGATTSSISGLTSGIYSVTVTDENGCTTTSSNTVTQPATGVSASASTTANATCTGCTNGSVSVSASGGTSPYTYLWSNGATTSNVSGLGAGTYSVTVTDHNGCTATSSTTVTQPSNPLVASITSESDVTCNGGNNGSASVTASGGTPGYTYLWSDGETASSVSDLTAGGYTVTVTDAASNQTTATVTINQPSALTASGSTGNVSCNGNTNGTASVTASGGTSPYAYSWSTGATTSNISGLSVGSYSVTVTDHNGCTTTATGLVVSQPATLTIGTPSITNVSCYGGNNGSVSLGSSSTVNYNYTGSVQNFTVPAGITSITVSLAGGSGGGNGGLGASFSATCTVTPGDVIGIAVASAGQTNSSFNSGGGGGATYIYDITQNTLLAVAGGGGGASTNAFNGGAAGTNLSGNTSGNGGGYEGDASNGTGGNGGGGGTGNNPGGGGAGWLSNGASAVNGVGIAAGGLDKANGFLGGFGTDYIANSNGGFGGGGEGSEAGGGGGGYNGGGGGNDFGYPANGGNGGTSYLNGTVSGSVAANNSGNGSASISYNSSVVSGGTSPYSYAWSNGATTASASGLTAGTYSVTVTDAHGCTATASTTVNQPSSAVSANGSVTGNVSCFGGNNGSASVTASGGTAGYSYLWSDGETTSSVSDLAAGTYSVQVTDANGCTATATGLSVSQPSAVTATVTSSTEPLCNGQSNGTATVTAGGGTPGYTYLWSNGETTSSVSDLAANTYSVTVTDANGCSANTSVTISQPAVLVLNTSAQTNVSCYGGSNGSATVNAAGGTSHIHVDYTYSWSPTGNTNNSVTGLSAGTYTVTVTDKNGCTATDIVTITQPAQLTASVTSETDVTCNGNSNGAATVTAGGGTPAYTYSWSNGETTSSVSDLAAGTYTVTVNDANHCGPVTATVTVNQPTAVTANITAETDVTCNGNSNGMATVTAGGGNGTYTYSWSNGETTSSVSDLEAGTYTVTVYDGIGCGPATATVTVNQPAVLVVNGSTGNVTCNGGSNGTASVTASGGTSGYSYSWSNGQTTSSISGLTVGTYSVLVTDAKGCTATATGLVVSQPNALSASITSSSNASCYACYDGSVTITASNGTPPYTYSWSDGETTSSVNDLGVGFYSCTITDACTSVVDTITIGSNSLPLALADTMTNVSCNGGSNGSITFTPSGGTPPYDIWYYSYLTSTWTELGTTTVVTGLPAGQYDGYVADASGDDAYTGTITITQPNPIVAYGSETDASCYGNSDGSVSVSPVGGTAPYNYSWNGGATTTSVSQSGLAAGTYSLVITDGNGCTFDTTFNVGQPALLTLSTSSVTNVSCYGSCNGSATVTANGGTGHYYVGYTYNWEPTGGTSATATGLCAGTYTVTVTDLHGCTATDIVTIGQPAAVTATIASETDVTCNDGTNGMATVSAGGGNGTYTYSWSDGETTSSVSDLSAGTYTVTVYDGIGCGPATAIVTVNQPTALTITGTSYTASTGSNGTASVTVGGGTPAYSYSWSNGSSTSSISGLAPGTYTVSVNDAHGCGPVTTTVIVPSSGGCATPVTPTICYVSVDTNSTHNVVYWDTTGMETYNIQSFNIYRKNTSGYVLIGNVPSSTVFSGDFSYTDNTSNTDKESYFYELSGVNYCSTEGALSADHQTILLQANIGVGNTVNLDWNNYVGNVVNYYEILRDTDNTGFKLYDSVPFGITNYTDLTPSSLSKPLAYMVNAVWSLSCSSSTVSHSNKKYINNVTGINEVSPLNAITVYPNPVKDEVTISIPTPAEGVISMTDVLGQQVYSTKLENNETTKQIDMTNLAHGVYMIKITSGDKQIVKRIVKL